MIHHGFHPNSAPMALSSQYAKIELLMPKKSSISPSAGGPWIGGNALKISKCGCLQLPSNLATAPDIKTWGARLLTLDSLPFTIEYEFSIGWSMDGEGFSWTIAFKLNWWHIHDTKGNANLWRPPDLRKRTMPRLERLESGSAKFWEMKPKHQKEPKDQTPSAKGMPKGQSFPCCSCSSKVCCCFLHLKLCDVSLAIMATEILSISGALLSTRVSPAPPERNADVRNLSNLLQKI